MEMNNPGFVSNPNNFKVEYVVEYIDNPKVWDLFCNDYYENGWEAYTKKTFDNASEAMELFTVYRVNRSRIYDCKLWMHIESPNGDWYEEFIDTSGTYRHTMNQLANAELEKQIDRLEKEVEDLSKTNVKLIEYLKKYNVDVYKVLNEEEVA